MNSTATRQDFGTRGATAPTSAHRQRTLGVLVATLALVLGLVGTAQARGYEDGVVDEGGRFYANFDEDMLLFSGGTAEQFCDDDEPVHEARVFQRSDGTTLRMVDGSEQPIHLYVSDLGAPEFLDAHCPSPPDPDASGWGTVMIRQHWSAEGPPLRLKNQTVGTVSAPDGTTWRVRGWADLHFIDGVPQGTPETFQGLHITRLGS